MKKEKKTHTHINTLRKGETARQTQSLSNADVFTDWPTVKEAERQKDKHTDTHRDRERQDSF